MKIEPCEARRQARHTIWPLVGHEEKCGKLPGELLYWSAGVYSPRFA
jgi:hypothetical protein